MLLIRQISDRQGCIRAKAAERVYYHLAFHLDTEAATNYLPRRLTSHAAERAALRPTALSPEQ